MFAGRGSDSLSPVLHRSASSSSCGSSFFDVAGAPVPATSASTTVQPDQSPATPQAHSFLYLFMSVSAGGGEGLGRGRGAGCMLKPYNFSTVTYTCVAQTPVLGLFTEEDLARHAQTARWINTFRHPASMNDSNSTPMPIQLAM